MGKSSKNLKILLVSDNFDEKILADFSNSTGSTFKMFTTLLEVPTKVDR